jgi:hypothetical protein
LLDAIKDKRQDIISGLIENGANVNHVPETDDIRTYDMPILYAAKVGDTGVLEALILAGADVNAHRAINYGPQTALQAAVEARNVDVAKLLLSYGANPNDKAAADFGCTSLEGAIRNRDAHMTQVLLEGGSDPLVTELAPALEGAFYEFVHYQKSTPPELIEAVTLAGYWPPCSNDISDENFWSRMPLESYLSRLRPSTRSPLGFSAAPASL